MISQHSPADRNCIVEEEEAVLPSLSKALLEPGCEPACPLPLGCPALSPCCTIK